jgi:hypothetical protein
MIGQAVSYAMGASGIWNSNMTKHVPPTKFIRTNYTRPPDGAIMVEREKGWFVYSGHASAKPRVVKDYVEAKRPSLTELERLEHSMAESPENISGKFVGNKLAGFFRSDETVVSVINGDGAVFTDSKRRVWGKPRCNVAISMTPPINTATGLTTWFKEQASLADAAWTPMGRFRDLVQSDRFWWFWRFLGDMSVQISDDVNDALLNRARIERYNAEYPSDKHPDSRSNGTGLIPGQWKKPKTISTKHADIPEHLKAVLLDYYRAHRGSSELVQTNFFHGDNDHAPKEDAGQYIDPLKVACVWETRPSVEEMIKAAYRGVEFKTRDAFTDSLGNRRPATLVPVDGACVVRDSNSRTVLERERERESAFAKHIAKMTAEQLVEYAKNNKPPFTPPIRKLGGLRFATADIGEIGNNYRGELLATTSHNGIEYRPRDGIRKSKVVLTNKQRKQIKTGEAYRYANLCRDNGVDADAVTKRRIEPLSQADRATQWADKAKQARTFWLTGCSTKLDPAFFTASMSLKKAQDTHGVKEPANDIRIYSGLPWKLWPPVYLATSGSTSPLFADSPEEFLVETHERKDIRAAKSALSPDDVMVLDSFVSSESCAVLGSKTGDEGKHERTQERNGKERLLRVAAKYAAILAKSTA